MENACRAGTSNFALANTLARGPELSAQQLSAQRLHRYSRFAVGIVLALLPILIYFALHLRIGSAAVENWLPENRPERQIYNRFTQLFGHDHFLLISWEGCQPDAQLDDFTETLEREFAARPELGVRGVNSTARVLNALQTQARLPLDVAKERLRNFLIGSDDCSVAIVELNEASAAYRQEIVETIYRSAELSSLNSTEKPLVIAGEPYQMLMIDEASRDAMENFVIPSMLAAVLMAWCCLRSIKLTLVVFITAGIGQLCTVVLIYLVAGHLSAVMVVLPTLVFMLTLSSAIHLTNYYIDCGGDTNPDAPIRALKMGFKPCTFATVTTVFGFASLTVSQLEPVWQFGVLAACGLLASTVILLSVFPSVIRWRFSKSPSSEAVIEVREHHKLAKKTGELLARFAARFSLIIILLSVILFSLTTYGLTKLESSTEFTDMFAKTHPAIKHLDWIESHIGPISSLEILASYPISEEVDYLRRVREIQELQAALEESPRVVAVMSPASMLPDLPVADGLRATIQRAAARKILAGRIGELIGQKAIAVDEEREYWRITVRVAELKQANYKAVRGEILSLCQQFAEARNHRDSTPTSEAMTVSLTGLRVVVEEAHHNLLIDLSSSFMTAFLLITPAMVIVVRRFWLGLLIMIPNLLPVVLVFGGMGLLGIKLDVASILTASVALGIAVDDTLHLMSWYLHARKNHTNEQAVATALQHCSNAMLHTTVISCSAMLPFFFTAFEPTSKFALLMILILVLAVVADVILLPALLLSRLGERLTRTLS